MPKLTNQEKSARRYEALTKIADEFAKQNEDFRQFAGGTSEVTWRKLETFLKRRFEQGAKIQIKIIDLDKIKHIDHRRDPIVIESSVSGD